MLQSISLFLSRRRWRWLPVVVVLGATLACTPTYNWREMAAADGAIQVAFPGKPGSETRTLQLADQALPFTLTAVAANGATFAVGHVQVPATAATADLGQALIDSLVRHYPAAAVQQRQVSVRPLQPQRGQALSATEIRADDPGNPALPRLLARVFQRDQRWIQVVAVGPADRLSWETAAWFQDSVRLP